MAFWGSRLGLGPRLMVALLWIGKSSATIYFLYTYIDTFPWESPISGVRRFPPSKVALAHQHSK